jgi:hypothetical protein
MLSNMKNGLWMRVRKFLLLALVSACAHSPQERESPPTDAFSSVGDREAILVLYVSDLHSQLRPDAEGRGGYAQLRQWVDSERARAGSKTDVILVGGGDLIGKGSIPCQESGDKECVPFLRDMGLAYTVLGNYELYNTPSNLLNLVRSSGATFLGMNVAQRSGSASWATSPIKVIGAKSGLEFWLASWTSPFDIKGYNVRSFPSTSDWAVWKRQWDAPVLWVTHQELDQDLGLMKEACLTLAPQVQLLGLLKSNDHRVMQLDDTQCAPILEPGPFGRYALKMLLTSDPQNPGRLNVDSKFVEISGKGVHEDTKRRIAALYERYAPNADEVLFTAAASISRESLAQWVAEAYQRRTRADVAIVNLGFVKNELPKGAVSKEQFQLTLPHKNELLGLDWAAKDMEQALCSASRREADGDLDYGSELFFAGGARLENAGTPQCRLVTNKRTLKVVVDSYLVSRSARWLGRNIAPKTFRFGVDSRRVSELHLRDQKPMSR